MVEGDSDQFTRTQCRVLYSLYNMRPTAGAVIGLCPIGYRRIFEKPIILNPFIIYTAVDKKYRIIEIAKPVTRRKMRKAIKQTIKIILTHF